MRIRTIALSQDIDFRGYLQDAEKAIDALSDDELDLYEKDLEAAVLKLMAPPALRLVGSDSKPQIKSTKPSLPKYALPTFTGLLIAAGALFLLQNTQNQHTTSQNQWQLKGPTDTQTAEPDIAGRCNATPLQPTTVSVELSNAGYHVDPSAPLYLQTTDCKTNPTLQVLKGGVWTSTAVPYENIDGFLMQDGKLADFTSYLGETLRIQSDEGLSEEFTLIKAPTK
ncbi:MAG: hypothetical protein EOP10_13280 [Proteobacteria bacterium]|nr:MAG: hypothetical protein EOP10_13280 [Pseudomonadota bacterium]